MQPRPIQRASLFVLSGPHSSTPVDLSATTRTSEKLNKILSAICHGSCRLVVRARRFEEGGVLLALTNSCCISDVQLEILWEGVSR